MRIVVRLHGIDRDEAVLRTCGVLILCGDTAGEDPGKATITMAEEGSIPLAPSRTIVPVVRKPNRPDSQLLG
jgi:hypothetical protein